MRRRLNIPMLGRIIGSLMLLEACFIAIPLITCLVYGESDWIWFAATMVLTAVIGFCLSRIRPERKQISKRDSYLLTGSVWIVFSIMGMLPFIFGSPHLSVSSAFFESMSAFTTTGATTVDLSTVKLAHGILMWEALMQWLGGMGIILFTLAIIPALNTNGGLHMFNAEVTGVIHDKLRPRISQTALSFWGMYTFFTLVLAALLWIGPMSLFDSVCHAFGTLSTGGFSTRPEGLQFYNSDYVYIVVTVFMFIGGVNFAMIYRMLQGRFRIVSKNETIRCYIGAILLMSLLFAVSSLLSGEVSSWRDVTLVPLFQVVSTITSTGYLAPGFTIFSSFVLALTFIMMFSGGCAGSTSGGAKIDRLLYLKKFLGNELNRCIHPNAILPVKMNGEAVDRDLVAKVVAFLALYLTCIIAGGIILSMMGQPAVDSFFSAFSCISNTGLGASVTGYGEDFTSIPDSAMWVLSMLMLIGRLEIFTILAILTPAFWKR